MRAVEVAREEEDYFTHVFGNRRPPVEQLKEYSPISLVTENAPPFFLATARDDGLVPAVETLDMAMALNEMKIPYELHVFENGDHGFCLGNDHFEPWAQEKNMACAEWVPLAKTFLMHHINPATAAGEKGLFQKMMSLMAPPTH